MRKPLSIAALALSTLALAAIGLLAQKSISLGEPYLGDGLWRRHLEWLCVGGAAGIGAALVPPRWWRKAALPLLALGIAALAATVAGLGPVLAGAHRWLAVGVLTIHVASLFQIPLVLGLAWAASREPKPAGQGRRTGEAILIAAAVLLSAALLAAQPDLVGAAGILAVSIAVLASSRPTWIPAAGLGAVALAGPFLCWRFLLHDYQKARVLDFFSAAPDALGAGYQTATAGELVAAGGIAGRGFGSAAADGISRLANARTDFALTVVGHEWGCVGIAVALLLVAVIVAVCVRVALRSRDRFAGRVAVGAAALFAWQAGLHAAVNLGLLPVVSAPGFPLVSYGGSGMTAALVCVGLVVRGATGLTTPPPAPPPLPTRAP